MRKTQAFRPMAGEALEDRAVPTGGFGGLPAADAQKVIQAFVSFEKTYNGDVQTILFAPGTTDLKVTRPAFDTAIASAIGDLNTKIDSAIANLPTAAALTTTINGELLSGTNSLENQLLAMATPTAVTTQAARIFRFQSDLTIDKLAGHVTYEVATAKAPTGTIDTATTLQAIGKVNDAFFTFAKSYRNDVKTVLTPSGTTNPSMTRAAFDKAVAGDIATLNSNLATALGGLLPATVVSSLSTTISNDLLTATTGTPTGKSLQERLAAVQTPKSASGFPMFLFGLNSSAVIGGTDVRVIQDVVSAISTYNNSL